MTDRLTLARRAVRPIARACGYVFCESSKDWMKNSVMHADLHRFGDTEGEFVIGCGCDYKLPQEERNRLWLENGEKLLQALKAAGFKPDPTPYGAHQRQSIVITVPEELMK